MNHAASIIRTGKQAAATLKAMISALFSASHLVHIKNTAELEEIPVSCLSSTPTPARVAFEDKDVYDFEVCGPQNIGQYLDQAALSSGPPMTAPPPYQ
eukprot:9531078-Ditylum_brightwellii.AAC.1